MKFTLKAEVEAESKDQLIYTLHEAYNQFCSMHPDFDKVAYPRTKLFKQLIESLERGIQPAAE